MTETDDSVGLVEVRCIMNEDEPKTAKFKEAARPLDCDLDEARFEQTVKKVAKPPKPAPGRQK